MNVFARVQASALVGAGVSAELATETGHVESVPVGYGAKPRKRTPGGVPGKAQSLIHRNRKLHRDSVPFNLNFHTISPFEGLK